MHTLRFLMLAVFLSLASSLCSAQTVPTDPTGGGSLLPAPPGDDGATTSESIAPELGGWAARFGDHAVRLFLARYGWAPLSQSRVATVARRQKPLSWRSR